MRLDAMELRRSVNACSNGRRFQIYPHKITVLYVVCERVLRVRLSLCFRLLIYIVPQIYNIYSSNMYSDCPRCFAIFTCLVLDYIYMYELETEP